MNLRKDKIMHSCWFTADETRVFNKVSSLIRRDKEVGGELLVLFEDIILNVIKQKEFNRI